MSDMITRQLAQAGRSVSVPRIALTVTEAAIAIGVSRPWFEEHVAGDVRWIRRGRKRLVSVRELEASAERAATLTEEPK